MASQTTSNNRRLAANRANAQKSTGPKTTAGKIRSSLNAVKTGLTGRTILLSGEEAARYRAHVESFHWELQLVGELETNLVQSLADTQWRLNRIPGLESGLLALGRNRCAPDLFAEEKTRTFAKRCSKRTCLTRRRPRSRTCTCRKAACAASTPTT